LRRVYIKDYALYVPKKRQTYEQLAKATGLPPEVVRDKQGVLTKPLERHLSTSAMGIVSLKALARRNRRETASAQFLICAGSDFKDHYVWTIGTKIGWEALHRKILAFDITSQCVGSLVGLDFAKSKLQALGDQTASGFVTVSTKQSMIVDYRNRETSFMFDSSDGAVSVLLTNEEGGPRSKYEVLESSFISDGRFSEVIYAPFGERHRGRGESNWDYRAVFNQNRAWRKDMQKVSGENFRKVVLDSLEKSGYTVRDVSYIAVLHMKRSFHRELLRNLGIDEDRSIYLEMYGHMQGVDPFLSLDLAERGHKIKKGDVAVLTSAGTGWTWGATTVVANEVG
jgi:3-oxoacyl-[acyl-carrier-protein] synthase III